VLIRLPIFQSGGHAALITAAVFLYLPLPFLWKSTHLSEYGISWGKGFRSLAETLLVAVVVLVPTYIVFFTMFSPISWIDALPRHPVRLILVQLLVVSFPEEFFFRAWLQTELEERWGRPWKLIGAPVGPGLIVAAVLFAATHCVVEPTVFRALVFFPGLLFGWMRARTSSVVYPTLLHLVCNLTFIYAQKVVAI